MKPLCATGLPVGRCASYFRAFELERRYGAVGSFFDHIKTNIRNQVYRDTDLKSFKNFLFKNI